MRRKHHDEHEAHEGHEDSQAKAFFVNVVSFVGLVIGRTFTAIL
jgi:hypothetical protein